MKTIYKLTMVFLKNEPVYPARLATILLGYYTSLKEAALIFRRPQKISFISNQNLYFKTFLVEKYFLNKWQDDPISHRVYDRNGKFYDEHQFARRFIGRDKNDCRFQLKQIVEYIQYNMEEQYLNVGIIIKLPPSPEECQISGVEFLEQDACYNILTLSGSAENFDGDLYRYELLNTQGKSIAFEPFIYSPARSIGNQMKNQLLKAYNIQSKL